MASFGDALKSWWGKMVASWKSKPVAPVEPTPTPTPTPEPTPTPTPTPVPTPTPGTRLFTGDYSTGNFKQWKYVQNKFHNGDAAIYNPQYPATIVSDPVRGKVARFEVRPGDFVSPGDRSEVSGRDVAQTGPGVRWYGFSTKFDTSFPVGSNASYGWGTCNQWHGDTGQGKAPLAWSFAKKNGVWSLVATQQNTDYSEIFNGPILHVPLNVGQWHDVKMEVNWSSSDTTGYVRCWINGVRQTFLNGSQTFMGRTLIPGGASLVYYKEGIYRMPNVSPTTIIYHTGFRMATGESGV